VVDLSIIIATCNSAGFVVPCLRSITEEPDDLRKEIIAVDNASTDGTVETIGSCFPKARILINRLNVGHCRAINAGIAAARGTTLMVLDVDTILMPGTLRPLVEFLRGHPEAAIVAPRMFNADGSLQETARRFPGVANAVFGRQTTLTRLWPNNRFSRAYLHREHDSSSAPFEVDWVSAACMVFPRRLVEQLGFWDEGFGGYWVDADWCARAHAAGRV
jgi:GT2 family glycosyltransferase